MFLDDPSDSKDEQRFKNMILFKLWMTNKERDELFESPFFGWMMIIIIVMVTIGVCANWK